MRPRALDNVSIEAVSRFLLSSEMFVQVPLRETYALQARRTKVSITIISENKIDLRDLESSLRLVVLRLWQTQLHRSAHPGSLQSSL